MSDLSASQHVPTPQRDNLFGVCHRLGETFGISPLVLRIAILVGMLIRFEAAAIAYAIGAIAIVSADLIERATGIWRRRQSAS